MEHTMQMHLAANHSVAKYPAHKHFSNPMACGMGSGPSKGISVLGTMVKGHLAWKGDTFQKQLYIPYNMGKTIVFSELSIQVCILHHMENPTGISISNPNKTHWGPRESAKWGISSCNIILQYINAGALFHHLSAKSYQQCPRQGNDFGNALGVNHCMFYCMYNRVETPSLTNTKHAC